MSGLRSSLAAPTALALHHTTYANSVLSSVALSSLVQEPNSFFMDVRCLDCFTITCVFSHAQSVVYCSNCSTMLCTPTGGLARLSEGCSFRKKTA